KQRLKTRPEGKYVVGRGVSYEYPSRKACPHCHELLVRPVEEIDWDHGGIRKLGWAEDYGYLCRNPGCHVWIDNREKAGSAWDRAARAHGARMGERRGGYIDLARARHFRCVKEELNKPTDAKDDAAR